jgi:LysR family hydrogen peroxide-inducible transcriptional activator
MALTLKELEYLIAVADAGTMRRAAEACGIAQPTLSLQLAKLEDDLDCLLFERTRNGMRLTEQGERAVEHARKVLEAVDAMRASCRSQAHPLAGAFRLGLIPTVGPYLMPTLLAPLRRAYPRLELLLREETTRELIEGLRHSRLDAAVVSPPIDEPSLHVEPVLKEDLFVVAPAEHAVARAGALRAGDLGKHKLILLEEGHCLRDQTAWLCHLRPEASLIQASSVESLRHMVAAGMGLSVLPAMAVRGRHAQTANVRVVPFAKPSPARSLVLAFRRTHPEFGALCGLGKEMATWCGGV